VRGPKFQPNKNKNYFPLTVKIRTSEYQALAYYVFATLELFGHQFDSIFA